MESILYRILEALLGPVLVVHPQTLLASKKIEEIKLLAPAAININWALENVPISLYQL
jgi:hypothetical protein